MLPVLSEVLVEGRDAIYNAARPVWVNQGELKVNYT
jgi:hypothetical protein